MKDTADGMRILCLYNNDCALELFDWLGAQGHDITLCAAQINPEWCGAQRFDLAVSYTYRYILTKEQLAALGYNVVNIHNSFLPWNRGADPNIWSIVDDTPRGVTLHYMEEGLDKGGIIAQELVPGEPGETLRSSYDALDRAAKRLFRSAFAYYHCWPEMKKVPSGTGSYHSLKDGERIKSMIDTYDLPVSEFKRRISLPAGLSAPACFQ